MESRGIGSSRLQNTWVLAALLALVSGCDLESRTLATRPGGSTASPVTPGSGNGTPAGNQPSLPSEPTSMPPSVPIPPSGSGTGSGNALPPFDPARTLTVCSSGCDFTRPSQAIAAARDLDRIQIRAGDYADCASLPAIRLWIQGVGGRVHLRDSVCESKGIFVTNGGQITIENVELSGMQISCELGQNGAGVRHQAGSLLLRNAYVHDGQTGILTNGDPSATLTVENSHFARLGINSGAACGGLPWNHDIYIGAIGSFTLRNTILEQNPTGNVVKSRAHRSVIECNRVVNGYDAAYTKNGYLIDLPQGGEGHVRYNTIAQGTFNGGQATMVGFAAEGASNPTQSLAMTGNLLLNDLGAGSMLHIFNAPSGGATIQGNVYVGAGTQVSGQTATMSRSGDQAFASRAAAGLSGEFPRSSSCQGPLGLVTVP